MAKIAVVVGNGLSKSFGLFTGLDEMYNTSEPLNWDVKSPSTKNLLLEDFPLLWKLYVRNYEKTSFKIFELCLSEKECHSINLDCFKVKIEARHYLTISFSHYSNLIIEHFSEEWPWFKWLKMHGGDISAAYSLNYDTLLETMFDNIGIEYHSSQLNCDKKGIPLLKPHGSVDFDSKITYILTPQKPTYPLQNWVDLNDTGIIRVDRAELLNQRKQAHCILPNEANEYSKFCWVEDSHKYFHNATRAIDYCLFIGISYMECDRADIRRILEKIPMQCVIIIANISPPPPEFISDIKGRPYIVWNNIKGPVDENDELLSLEKISRDLEPARCLCGSSILDKY
ncbi:hypothetical protein ACSZNZ_11535 [Aeromonas caviae]|uniref:hypothetical protein n=1 Tax=Aeromonas caviae TaxID=648 RepID=UPI003EC50663